MTRNVIGLNLFLINSFLLLMATGSAVRISFIEKALDNFHSVEPGVLYRSAQLSPGHLVKYIKRHGIRSVINLRGENKNSSWWRAEKKAANSLGVKIYNLRFCAQSMESKKNIKKLLDLYKIVPRPILVHCKSGIDRTGEASALWVLEQQRKSKKHALRQLSLRYGYFRFRAPTKYFLVKHWQGLDNL